MNRLVFITIALVLGSPSALGAQRQVISAEDRPITVEATGLVAASDVARFGPPPNRSWQIAITKIAREGQRVNEGDVLAEFDGAATDDRVKEKQSELAAKQSELESVLETQAREAEEDKVSLAEAESAARKAARKADVDVSVYAGLEYRKLVEEKRITAELAEYERRRVALAAKVRQLTLDELRADARRLESELAAAEKELASFTLRSPRSGLVIVGTNRDVTKLDVNDTVNPGMTIVEVIDDSDLVIDAEVPEFAAARLVVGQQASVTLDATVGGELSGTVVEVASIVRRQSRFSQAMVRDVRIQLDEVSDALRPGMTAKISLVVDMATGALAVPEDAIRYRDGEPGVTLVSGGWRRVTLGETSAGMRIIEEGMSAGEEIEW